MKRLRVNVPSPLAWVAELLQGEIRRLQDCVNDARNENAGSPEEIDRCEQRLLAVASILRAWRFLLTSEEPGR